MFACWLHCQALRRSDLESVSVLFARGHTRTPLGRAPRATRSALRRIFSFYFAVRRCFSSCSRSRAPQRCRRSCPQWVDCRQSHSGTEDSTRPTVRPSARGIAHLTRSATSRRSTTGPRTCADWPTSSTSIYKRIKSTLFSRGVTLSAHLLSIYFPEVVPFLQIHTVPSQYVGALVFRHSRLRTWDERAFCCSYCYSSI